jgi:hypothetical protein
MKEKMEKGRRKMEETDKHCKEPKDDGLSG